MSEHNIGDELYPQGPEADEMAIEHQVDGHPNPPDLSIVSQCPLCYATMDIDHSDK